MPHHPKNCGATNLQNSHRSSFLIEHKCSVRPSRLGNGKLSLLFLTIAPDIYNKQSNVVLVPPYNYGPYPVIPQNLTAAYIADICRHYDVDLALYTKYNITDKALNSFLISAVNKTYIRYLWDKYIGYANIIIKKILAQLYLAYAKISDGDLEYNDK